VITDQPERPKGSTQRTGAPQTTHTTARRAGGKLSPSSYVTSSGGGSAPLIKAAAAGVVSVELSTNRMEV
jgi:hypothetical protein